MREVLELSELAKFVRRSDKLSAVDRAEITVQFECISVKLSQELPVRRVDPKTLRIGFECWDPRLSYLTQFCASCLPTLSHFDHLHILLAPQYAWPEITTPNPQWLDLFRLFDTVEGLHLSRCVSLRVARALRGLPAEGVMDVLPALKFVVISGLESGGLVTRAMDEFRSARELSGHPVSIYDWG